MTIVQYFQSMDLYRVWEWNKQINSIKVRYCTLDEVLYVLSTKESNSGLLNLK